MKAQELVSANLKRLRKELSLTQAQAAELLDVSLRAYQTWEQSWYFPDANSLNAIAKGFKVPLTELFRDFDGKETKAAPKGSQKRAENISKLDVKKMHADELVGLIEALFKMSKARTAFVLALIHNDESYFDELPQALAQAAQPLRRALKIF